MTRFLGELFIGKSFLRQEPWLFLETVGTCLNIVLLRVRDEIGFSSSVAPCALNPSTFGPLANLPRWRHWRSFLLRPGGLA